MKQECSDQSRAGGIVPLTSPDALGVGNPEALEIVVFAGADGRFELYEDDDARQPRTVRTPLSWSDAARTLTIGPADGDAGVVPATRRYTLRVVGVGPGTAEGRSSRYDAPTSSLTVEVGDVDTASGVVVRVAGGAPTASNRELERIEAFLLRTDMDVQLKEGLWDALAAEPSFGRRMMVLEGFTLAPELRGVLAEILLAAPQDAS